VRDGATSTPGRIVAVSPEMLRRTVGTAVILPGTASDEVFVREVFHSPLAEVGVRLVAPPPVPGPRVVEHHVAALDAAWEEHGAPVVVGGVSLGAHLAAAWAVRHPERCAGLLVALPAWNGAASTAPAVASAVAAASAIDRHGFDLVVRGAVIGVRRWLADELHRAWRRHGTDLAATLLAAADSCAPTLDELRSIGVPTGVGAFTDDPIHPLEVARRWKDALPRSALRTTTLAAMDADRTALGRATVDAWLAA